MLVFVLFTVLSNIALVLVGENRFDVYIALTILVYYVLYAVLDPLLGKTTKYFQGLNIGLFILFMVIVVYRIMEILATI